MGSEDRRLAVCRGLWPACVSFKIRDLENMGLVWFGNSFCIFVYCFSVSPFDLVETLGSFQPVSAIPKRLRGMVSPLYLGGVTKELLLGQAWLEHIHFLVVPRTFLTFACCPSIGISRGFSHSQGMLTWAKNYIYIFTLCKVAAKSKERIH